MYIVFTVISAAMFIAGTITTLANLFPSRGEIEWQFVTLGAVLIGIAIIPLSYSVIQIIKNYFVELHTHVKQKDAGIGILEKQYDDLEKKLQDLVEKYFSHEKSLLDAVKDRSSEKLSALFENYPELKAMGGTKELINKIVSLRNSIASAQSDYNYSVRSYNEYALKAPYKNFIPEELEKSFEYIDLKDKEE